ncbi:MAG: acetolactate synthase small subunit [Candidatus Omnitrophica bacterium]|nr:acetolactate synthase small subunit [Candidatus Omnitrophota bacterium]
MNDQKRKDIHTISFLVANKPGVLMRVAQIFARRGFNIDALVVSPSYDPKYSRMTITAQGSPDTLEQIIKVSGRLIDVLHVAEHSQIDALHRELALIKVKYTPATKVHILKLVKKFHAHLLEEKEKILVIEQAGTTDDLDELESLLKKYGVVEMVRSGKLVMAHGHEAT